MNKSGRFFKNLERLSFIRPSLSFKDAGSVTVRLIGGADIKKVKKKEWKMCTVMHLFKTMTLLSLEFRRHSNIRNLKKELLNLRITLMGKPSKILNRFLPRKEKLLELSSKATKQGYQDDPNDLVLLFEKEFTCLRNE